MRVPRHRRDRASSGRTSSRRSARSGHEVVAALRARRRSRGVTCARRRPRRGSCATRRRAATACSTAPARSRASRRTPRSSTGSTSRARRRRSTPAARPACGASSSRARAASSPSRAIAGRTWATEADATPIGLIARWPYYRSKLYAERAALERSARRLRGRLREPDAPARARATCTARRPSDVRQVPRGHDPGGARRRPVVRRRARRRRGDASSRWSAAGRASATWSAACNLTVATSSRASRASSGVPAPVAADAPVARAWPARRARALGAPRGTHRRRRRGSTRVSVEMAQHFWYVDAAQGGERARLDGARPRRDARRHGGGPARRAASSGRARTPWPPAAEAPSRTEPRETL